jgi:phasin
MRMLAGRMDRNGWALSAQAAFARYGTGYSKGDHNMSADQSKQFADKSARMVRENLEKGIAAAEQSARGVEQGYSIAAENIRDFNLRLIEMAQANATATLEFVQQISTAKGPSEAIELWSSYARRQFETLTDQSKELTALGQKIATSSAEPIARSFGQALKGAS